MKDVLENFGKIQAPVPEPQSIFIKKRLGTGVFFFVDFAKFSRVRFFIKTPVGCFLMFRSKSVTKENQHLNTKPLGRDIAE